MSTSGGHPAVGERIGPYRIVRRLGGGGMGVVLEAYDEALNRRVALKVIAPHLAEDADFRARFTREARALASLDSEHVVHVYAHGQADGRLYLATQLVPDGDLDRMIGEHGAPAVRDALDLVAQVADGLADAHAAGLVHRDIKPANVLLRRREGRTQAYLSDFGVARVLGAEHTHGSGAIGTPAYLAPELHTGGEAGVASDVYSLGCLLWAALSGHAPYVGTSDYEIARAHLADPVPRLPGSGPLVSEVNRILARAMAKDPADRYGSVAELRDALRRTRMLPDTGVAGLPAAADERRPLVVLGAGVVVLALLVGGIAYAATRGGDERPGSDLEAATASLAGTLEQQGVMTPEQAACTAERWIEQAGLQEMRDAGFFDDEWNYVDQDRSAMTPAIEAAATAAALACAT